MVYILVCIIEESTISEVNIDVILGIFKERFHGVLGLVNHNVRSKSVYKSRDV
jgi:hypothetical protein